jgi:hypothetical protein
MNSCKDEAKNAFNESFQSLKVSVTLGDSLEINKQLKWIAKGVAGITHQNSTVKASIHGKVETTDFNSETNENLQTHLNGLNFDYSSEVYDWLQTNIPSNDYDGAYFFDIDMFPCESKTLITIPDAEDVDKNLLHVVTTSPVTDDDDLNEYVGYYINSSNLLDSLIITDQNFDSVYLWIVEFFYDCELEASESLGLGGGDCDKCKNGKCRPECGDKWPDCPSCPQPIVGATPPTGKDYFTLRLVSINYTPDKKNCTGSIHYDSYQENFIKGRYQLRFGYGIWEYDHTLPVGNQFNMEFLRMSGIDPVTKNPEKLGDKTHFKAGRFRPYKKGGGKRYNCNRPNNKDRKDQINEFDHDLHHHYYPYAEYDNADGHIFAFYLMEYDLLKGKNSILPIVNTPSGSIQLQSNSWPYSSVINQNVSDPNFNEFVHVLPELSGWTQISPDLYTYTITFDEAELIFELSK